MAGTSTAIIDGIARQMSAEVVGSMRARTGTELGDGRGTGLGPDSAGF